MLTFRTNTKHRRNESVAEAKPKARRGGRKPTAAAPVAAPAPAPVAVPAPDTTRRPGRPSKAQAEAKREVLASAAQASRASSAFSLDKSGGAKPTTSLTGVTKKKGRAERAALRKKLTETYAELTIPELKGIAKDRGIKGLSQMTVAELRAALVRFEYRRVYPQAKKEGKGGRRGPPPGTVPKAETRLKISQKHKARQGQRAGKGIYRVAVFVNGTFDPKRGADLGPYATARAAAIDAKTLLRTAARVEDHRISQKQALDMIDAGAEALQEFEGSGLGTVVDGFIVDGLVNGRNWEAWVYRVKNRDIVTTRALLDNVIADGDMVDQMTLRANTRRMNARRNKTVSFRTSDGRKISFQARK